MNDEAQRLWEKHPDDWQHVLRPAVLWAIELGNSGHDTRFLLGRQEFPSAHEFALEVNYWLFRWLGRTADARNPDWKFLEAMPELLPLTDELFCRLSHEWRNAAAAAESRMLTASRAPTHTVSAGPSAKRGRKPKWTHVVDWFRTRQTESPSASQSELLLEYRDRFPEKEHPTPDKLRAALGRNRIGKSRDKERTK